MRLVGLLIIGASATLALGCQEHDEQIRAYDVPKPSMNRILGVILPHGEDTWVFKLVGPDEAVGEAQAAFLQFVRSVQFSADKGRPLTWKAPDDWRVASDKGGYYSAYEVGPASAPLEFTVTRLPPLAASVLPNVNRWCRLLGLPALEAGEGLDEVAKPLALDVGNATLVDLVGPGSGKTRRDGPHGGGAHRPDRPDYTVPKGWKKVASVQFSQATFEAEEAGQVVKITMSPLAGDAGGLLKNVNRWRTDQAGLPEIGQDELPNLMKPFDAGEVRGQIVDIDGPTMRILAVIARRGNTTWFFKMYGPAEAVGRQQDNFKKFLGSIRFGGE
jgi:hypothetical protein